MVTPFPIPLTAAQVGTYFVGQYYDVLQNQSEFVHQFYSDVSTMLRIDGNVMETATAMLHLEEFLEYFRFSALDCGGWPLGLHLQLVSVGTIGMHQDNLTPYPR